MVHHCWIFLIFFLFSKLGVAQDERYYRHILTGELSKLLDEKNEDKVAQFNVAGPSYKVDINQDGIEETLQPQKRDGVDWLEIRDYSQNKIFEAKLLAAGADSVLYKIKMVNISPKVRSLILFFDEGQTKGRHFEATARIYVLTFENNNMNTMKMTAAPHFFHEYEGQREQYWRRDYNVNVYDIDGDGVREIAVMYNHIQRIMKYKGRGEWDRF